MAHGPPTSSQLARHFPGPTTYITGHNAAGESIVQGSRPAIWEEHDDSRVGMSIAYTTTFPADLNNDADIVAHNARTAPDAKPMGLVLANGTVLRFVELAPGHECMMHRTQSLDYGIVLEGAVESRLDSGQLTRMERGDVMVQRGTMHSWRNPSETEWARMIFCLQDCQPLVVGGKRLREDLGGAEGAVPPSGNDG